MNNSEYGFISEGCEREVGFYLENSFNMLPFISAIETLRIANRVSKKPLYQWKIITSDGASVCASNGMTQPADYSIETAPQLLMLFVSGPFSPQAFDNKQTLTWLRNMSRRDVFIGGMETGSHILAQAGLLDGYQCTTHWENHADFVQNFPKHDVYSDVYEHDRNRITCAGGAGAMDMMLYIIEQQHGHELAALVADSMIHPNIRNGGEPQRMNLQARIGVNHPSLLECIELMEANIEQPLSTIELAELIHISKRQLERLFRRYLRTTPARYYLTLRLESARNMLENKTMKVIDIALACGFKSAGHFSSRFYSCFGMTPRESRKADQN